MDTLIKDIAISHSKSLIHLYGSQSTHENIIKTLSTVSESKQHKNLKFVSHHFDDFIDNYDFDESTRYDGLMRISWFNKVSLDMPAVAILIYDWSNEDDSISWYLREEDIKVSVSKIREKSRDAKIMLLVFLPANEAGSSPSNKIENKISSLKKNTELEPKCMYFVYNGISGFNLIASKFEKTMYDFYTTFYKDLKNNTKLKQKRLTKDDILNVRYNFKNGYFTEIIKEPSKAIKFYQESYDLLSMIKEGGSSKYSTRELRGVADIVVLKLIF